MAKHVLDVLGADVAGGRRRDVGIKRAAALAVAEPVAVQAETITDRPACLAAHDTRAGPGALRRRRRCEPPLTSST